MMIVLGSIARCIIFGVPRLPVHPCDERPPAMYGHFCLVPRVSVHDRYYCKTKYHQPSFCPPLGSSSFRHWCCVQCVFVIPAHIVFSVTCVIARIVVAAAMSRTESTHRCAWKAASPTLAIALTTRSAIALTTRSAIARYEVE